MNARTGSKEGRGSSWQERPAAAAVFILTDTLDDCLHSSEGNLYTGQTGFKLSLPLALMLKGTGIVNTTDACIAVDLFAIRKKMYSVLGLVRSPKH